MKCSMVFIAAVTSLVITPAVAAAANSSQLYMHEASSASPTIQNAPMDVSCESLIEDYYVDRALPNEPQHIVNVCLKASRVAEQESHVAKPKKAKVSILADEAHSSTTPSHIPSKASIEEVKVVLESGIKQLAERHHNMQSLDDVRQAEYLLCGRELSGGFCKDGHIMPHSKVLRKVAQYILSCYRSQLGVNKATAAMEKVLAHKMEIATTLSKMASILVATYPEGKQDRKSLEQWMKSYYLVEANVRTVTSMLNSKVTSSEKVDHSRKTMLRTTV